MIYKRDFTPKFQLKELLIIAKRGKSLVWRESRMQSHNKVFQEVGGDIIEKDDVLFLLPENFVKMTAKDMHEKWVEDVKELPNFDGAEYYAVVDQNKLKIYDCKTHLEVEDDRVHRRIHALKKTI